MGAVGGSIKVNSSKMHRLSGRNMRKLYTVARALAVLVAIVAAFVTIPYVAVILLALGAISAIGNTPENNSRVFLIAIVLVVGSKSLDAIPTVGTYLSTIFGGIGTAAIGASVLAIVLGLYARTIAEWNEKPA
jgi:hypothetical protein